MRGGNAATVTGGRDPAARARSASLVLETRFALARHVFACVDGSHVVLLDLKRDEYYALDLSVTRGLAALVPGWPDAMPANPHRLEAAQQAANDTMLVVQSLVTQGLLVNTPAAGKHMHSPHVRRAENELQASLAETTRVTACDLAQVARATVVAALMLRCCSLERIVGRTRARKRGATISAADLARLADRVRRFERLRPLFFSARGACLLESLALLEFLAGHRIHPDWVFGVRTRPFAAHCWVQYSDTVCNDLVERVRRFTPILVA